MINGTWRRSLLGVLVRRGANISSDHYLAVASLRLKLRSAVKKTPGTLRPDVSRLKDPECKRKCVLQLRNRFDALMATDSEEADDNNTEELVDKSWNIFKHVYASTSRDVLGPRQNSHNKEWATDHTYKALNHRRKIRRLLLSTKSPRLQENLKTQYLEANREVKRSARRDKRAFVEEMALKAEEAAKKKD